MKKFINKGFVINTFCRTFLFTIFLTQSNINPVQAGILSNLQKKLSSYFSPSKTIAKKSTTPNKYTSLLKKEYTWLEQLKINTRKAIVKNSGFNRTEKDLK